MGFAQSADLGKHIAVKNGSMLKVSTLLRDGDGNPLYQPCKAIAKAVILGAVKTVARGEGLAEGMHEARFGPVVRAHKHREYLSDA